MMVEEEAMASIKGVDSLHVVSVEFKIKQIQILLHPFLMDGLRDDDHVVLQQPAQRHLRRRNKAGEEA